MASCRISLRVKPGSRQNTVSLRDDGSLDVRVSSQPVDGKANTHVIKLLSETFHIPKSAITIIHGASGKDKLVEIDGMEKDVMYFSPIILFPKLSVIRFRRF